MKVAIIGGECESAEYLPIGDEWEFWGLNAIRPNWAMPAKWSRWFNLHRVEHLQQEWAKGLKAEFNWASKNTTIPFYVIGVDDWLRVGNNAANYNFVEFPMKQFMALNDMRNSYHAGSFDMMVSFAISLGAKEISLHGIKLMDSGEPISARACMEYWCGVAEGRGVKVTTDPDCDLFYQYHFVKSNSIYGYDDIKLIEDRT